MEGVHVTNNNPPPSSYDSIFFFHEGKYRGLRMSEVISVQGAHLQMLLQNNDMHVAVAWSGCASYAREAYFHAYLVSV
jgi:hypothetical protein